MTVRPSRQIDGCRTAQAALLARVRGLDEEAVRRPSRLPDWTVAHVLGHLVGNADSVVRRLRGVIEDRVADQYPGGEQGRADEIERLSTLPAAELVVRVSRSCAEVDAVVGDVPDDGWDRMSRSVGGTLTAARDVVFSRWREVEVHHTDLGLGFTPVEWSPGLLDHFMPKALAGLPGRTAPGELLAWAYGRGPAPELDPWE